MNQNPGNDPKVILMLVLGIPLSVALLYWGLRNAYRS